MTTRVTCAALQRPVEAYLEELRVGRRLSPHTLDAYARDLAEYTEFAERHGLALWQEATVTFADAYFASLAQRRLAGATVSRRRSALRGFHAFLVRQGECADHPLSQLPAPVRERRLPHALSVHVSHRRHRRIARRADRRQTAHRVARL